MNFQKKIKYLTYTNIFIYLFILSCRAPTLYNANECDVSIAKKYSVPSQNNKIWQINRGFTSDALETIVDSVGLILQLKKIPANTSGIGIIDWEGEIEKGFEVQASNDLFNKSLKAHLEVIRIAKKIRPNLKWAYYGYPTTRFWNLTDSSWKEQNDRLKPLLQASDLFAPSMYLFYPDKEVGKESNVDYAKANTTEVLHFADEYDKKVYPFVWHRFHPSNLVYGLQLIPANQFKNHIHSILSIVENKNKIDGIIWWGSDRYFYNVKSKALMEESASFRSFEDYYYEKVIVVYSKLIQDELKKRKK